MTIKGKRYDAGVWLRRLAAPACLVLFGVLAWHNTLENGFVYDDQVNVVENKGIRSLTPLSKFLDPAVSSSDEKMNRMMWRPLTRLVWAVDYRIGGLDPRSYHLTNVVFHVVNALLVYWLVLLLFKRRGAAFITSLVFLIHPVQAESVAWVNGLPNVMYLFFYLLAFIAFVRWREGGAKTGYALSLAFFGAALLCKEMSVTLPAVLVLYLFMRQRREGGLRLLEYVSVLPHFLLLAAFMAVRGAVLGNTSLTGNWAGGPLPMALTMLKGFAYYVKLALAPYPLSLEYLFSVSRVVDVSVLGSIVLLGCLAWIGFSRLKREPRLGFGILLFFLVLAPVSNLIPIEAIINERSLYFSMVGWGLVVSAILGWTLKTRLGQSGVLRAAALAALCIAYAGVTIDRNRDWKDTYSLAKAGLETCPQSARLHYAMGKAHAQRGEWRPAIEEYRTALAIEVYEDSLRGEIEAVEPFGPGLLEDVAEYRESTQIRMDRGQTLYNIGSAYIRTGENEKAVGYLKLAKKIDPRSPEVANNLAVALAHAGEPEKAAGELRALLARDPTDAKAVHNLPLFMEMVSARFVPELKERYPGLKDKWARLDRLRYDETDGGVSPFVGYMGSAQAAAGLKPEERRALADLAARRGFRRRAPPVFPRSYGEPYTVRLGEAAVEVRPLGAEHSRAEVRDGVILYPEAYPETSVFYTASHREIEEFYYLKSRKAPKSFVQELRPKGGLASFRVNERGNLEALDAGGAKVLELSRPEVIDAAGKRILGRFSLKGGRGTLLALSFDDAGLEYPILIDPTWTTAGSPAMSKVRGAHTATLLPNGKVLVAGGDGTVSPSTAELYDPSAGTWTGTGSMSESRGYHTATLLPNGKVLVAGGSDSGTLSTAELYDPSAGTWTGTDSMSAVRRWHTATLLQSGKVLVAGGQSTGGIWLSTAELYDPSAGTWTGTGAMSDSRYDHTAMLLPSGKVLVAGGYDGSELSTAELYDPSAGTWTGTGAMSVPRRLHTATLLPNGKVLVAGGRTVGSYLSTAELYDPSAGTWTGTGALSVSRGRHTAILLPNGKVLVAGGYGSSALSTAELYDPSAGTWTGTGALSESRYQNTTTLLPNGKVLVAGGDNSSYLSTAELYDPSAGNWAGSDSVSEARRNHTATLLPDGKVLVAGGETTGTVYLSTAELYDPSAGTWATTGSMSDTRTAHSATLLPEGKVLVAGGGYGVGYRSTAELYDPSGGTWATTGSMSDTRYAHVATLLSGGKVLVAGGYNGGFLSTAELYDPAMGAWTTTGSMSVARREPAAMLLPDGKVLVAGGNDGGYLSNVELYDPSAGTWSTTGPMTAPRHLASASLLPNGKVLVSGGQTTGGVYLLSAELYDPSAGTWATTGSMSGTRREHAAMLLPSGRVLVAGGYNSVSLSTVELYDPASGAWTGQDAMSSARVAHAGVLLSDGSMFVVGGHDGTSYLSASESIRYTEYDYHAAPVASLQPKINTINGSGSFPVTLSPGNTYTVTGATFTGGGEASGGGNANMDSPTNHPRVYLMPVDNGGRLVDLSTSVYGAAEETYYQNGESSTTLDFTVPDNLQCGYYNFFVMANAIPSTFTSVRIVPPAPTATPAAASPDFPDVQATTLDVGWTVTGESSVQGYVVELSTAADFSGQPTYGYTSDPAQDTKTFAGLTPSTTYYFRAAAQNCNGAGPYSGSLGSTVTLPSPGFIVELPGVSAPYSAGTPQTVRVTAVDSLGATDTGYTGTITFSVTDGGPESPGDGLPANYMFVGNESGVKDFTLDLTLRGSGSRTVNVEQIDDAFVSGSTVGVNVVPSQPTSASFATAPRVLIAGTTVQLSAGTTIATNIDLVFYDDYNNVAYSTWAYHTVIINSQNADTTRAGTDPSKQLKDGNDWELIGPSESSLSMSFTPGMSSNTIYVWDTVVGTSTLMAVIIRQDAFVFVAGTQNTEITPGPADYITFHHPYDDTSPLNVGDTGDITRDMGGENYLGVVMRDKYGNIATGHSVNGQYFDGLVQFSSAGVGGNANFTDSTASTDVPNAYWFRGAADATPGVFNGLQVVNNYVEELQIFATAQFYPDIYGYTDDSARTFNDPVSNSEVKANDDELSDGKLITGGVVYAMTDVAPAEDADGVVTSTKALVGQTRPIIHAGDGNTPSNPDPVEVLRFDMVLAPATAVSQSASIRSMWVVSAGGLDAAHVARLELWYDEDADEQFNAATDVYIASAPRVGGSWRFGDTSQGYAQLDDNDPARMQMATSSKTYFVTARISSGSFSGGELPAEWGVTFVPPTLIFPTGASNVGVAYNNFAVSNATSSVRRQPAAVTDLAIASLTSAGLGENATVSLSWTSPGRDRDVWAITGGSFTIKYSDTGPILTEADYQAAPYSLEVPTNTVPGEFNTYPIAGLDPSSTFY
ncbi:kelch repeat-containing protein, partial [Elusimicrobiota bacterium]